MRGAGGLVGVVGKRSLRNGGECDTGGAWVLGERMAGSKKKRQPVWRFLSKIQKKCFHSELPTTNRLTIPD